MKNFIFILNTLLILLVLYNFLLKSSIIESLEEPKKKQNCPKDMKNIIFKQEEKINDLTWRISLMKFLGNKITNESKVNKNLINKNTGIIKKAVNDVKGAGDRKMKEMEKNALK